MLAEIARQNMLTAPLINRPFSARGRKTGHHQNPGLGFPPPKLDP
jgi:hypothetical protein